MSYDMSGAIDIHVHAGPSVAKRRVDAGDMLLDGIQYGYRAFVSKDHYFPTMMGTDMVTKFLGEGKCTAYGCICLNNAVGGINLHAVDAACAMGAKIVFMPTVSARNHIERHSKTGFVGAGKMKIPEDPIYYLDEKGELLPEVERLLAYLAEHHPEVVLGTGHGSVEEIDKLIRKASEMGLKKLLVNHPFFNIGAGIRDMVRWADLGALIELNAVVFNEVEPAAHHLDFSVVEEVFREVGFRRIIIDSDLGQAVYMPPAEGLAKFAQLVQEHCGATDEQMDIMLRRNPAWLLGLEERPA